MPCTLAVKISSDCYGYHDGQKDVLVQAAADGVVVGKLHYSVREGELYISHIWTVKEWRRQGVATSLLWEMERNNPGLPVDWGYVSESGAALRRAWKSSCFC